MIEQINKDWTCESCINFPPSCSDGKPCTFCNPEDPFTSSYCRNEDFFTNGYNDNYFDKDVNTQQQWHVIKKRPMTNDERIEWSERLGYDIEYEDAFIYSNLPDDGEEVLVSSRYRNVYVDKFCQDEGCYFEENGDMDGVVAWMPLPEPYREEVLK